MKPALSIFLALVVGCVAGTTAQHVMTPSADARASSTSQKWQHHCEDNIHNDNLEELGDDGWEMVGVTATNFHGDFRYCFKRPQ